MFYLNDLFPHDVVLKLRQKVIDLVDDPRRGVLDRKHRVIRAALLDRTHGIPETVHMKTVDPISEIPLHRQLGIGSLRSLKDHSRLSGLESVHRNKRKLAVSALLRQPVILQLAAHGHDLFKQLLHTAGIELTVCKRAHLAQLFLLSGLIQYLLPRLYLIVRDLRADLHTLLIELHDPLVDLIQLFP